MSNYSDFWLKDNHYEWDWEDELDVAIAEEDGNDATVDAEDRVSENTARLIRLSSARRAVANYVSILTNQNVPVVFNDSAVNCTDGKVVYISSDITKKDNFDVAVGLALHEGSHIKYSDFELFKTVWMNVPRDIYNYIQTMKNMSDEYYSRLLSIARQNKCIKFIKNIENDMIEVELDDGTIEWRDFNDIINYKAIADLKS